MNNYLVTFDPDADVNSEFSVSLRSKLEDISPKNWVQIFPFQIAIKTNLSMAELNLKLGKTLNLKRISIVKFDQWSTNEARSTNILHEYGY